MLFTPFMHWKSSLHSHTPFNMLLLMGIGLLFFGLLTGCQQDLPIPTDPPSKDPSKQWQTLITQSTSDAGIDWNHIEANKQVLEQYVAWVGTVGPQSNRRTKEHFPRRGRANYKLVHWVNAYNAWMIYSHLHHQQPTKMTDVEVSLGYMSGQRVYIDGEYTSFSHVKHERILADFQDPRLHFMLYDLVENSPSLQFWSALTWKSTVELSARKFLSSGKGAKNIENNWLFHPMFKTYEKDFLDWSEHNSLCTYLEQYSDGPLKLWLQDKEDLGCALTFFEHSTQIQLSPKGNSPSQD